MISLFVDCHTHLFFSPIPKEAIDKSITGEIPTPTKEFINRMISNAKEKGVTHFIGVISNPKDFPRYQEQLKLKDVTHVIGISRDNATQDNSKMIRLLLEEIKQKTPQAIGEIGLDYSYGHNELNEHEINTIKENQQDLFRKQIQIAKENNIPIVVHAGYGNDKDILEIIKQENAQDIGGQIHGYMSKKNIVSELLGMGFYFSFGHSHTINEELKKIVEITPLKQILTETDSPYHLIGSPQRFILPEDVVSIATNIAGIKNIKVKDFTEQVMLNARNLFKF